MVDSQTNLPKPKKKRKKYGSRKLYFTNPTTMERQIFTYEYSIWYSNYVMEPSPDCPKWNKMFRRRFRMPYESFLDLSAQCEESEHLKTWWSSNGFHKYNKQKVLPMKLLVLCALRYLGRSWTFDDLEEATAINYETNRRFLHQFIEFGSTSLYNKYVLNPINYEELKDNEHEFLMAGFPGCIGSTDATHVIMEVCSYRLRQLHLGYKLAHTARNYNMTVNHRRRIFNTTKGHPARFNDKTLVLFDLLVNQIHDGKFDDMFEFTLMAFGEGDEIIEVKYRGCYLIVDNGYLRWSVTVPPMKESTSRAEIRFSEWLESLRKDVECAFGILKARWRVLKSGIRLHGILNCDRIWLTCCALHNMLLEVDGLSEKWRDGVPSDWETSENPVPNAIQKLLNPNQRRRNDLSGMGHGNDFDKNDDNEMNDVSDVEEDEEENIHIPIPNNSDNGPIRVRDLSLNEFRRRLIVHFNIMFHQNKVVWPTRNKK